MNEHFWDSFQQQLESRGDQIALINRGRNWTWSELGRSVLAAQSMIGKWCELDAANHPVHIVHDCDNTTVDVLIFLACLRGGLVDVPIDSRWPAATKAELHRRSGGIAISADRLAMLASTRPDAPAISPPASVANPSDVALILWTSGTTAVPKGVRLSHRALVHNAAAKLNAVPQTPHDVRLTSLPICHAYARTCDLGTWLLSGCVLMLDRGMPAWDQLQKRNAPTLANVVPSMAKRLLAQRYRDATTNLRLLGCGGAGLDADTFHAWKDRGVTVIQGYGLTETGPVICSATPDDATAESIGGAVDGWEVRLVESRLYVRGAAMMNGYLDDEDATRTKIDGNGWLDTGDLVVRDPASGHFRILGRCDDVIVLPNGIKIHPTSIEQTLRTCVGVEEALITLRKNRLTVSIALQDATDDFEPVRAACRRIIDCLPGSPRDVDVQQWHIDATTLASLRTSKGTLKRNEAAMEF